MAQWKREAAIKVIFTYSSKRYAAEIHIVHYNSKYRNTEEAVKHPDGLAVLGVMVLQVVVIT